jgi:hypothetical protein
MLHFFGPFPEGIISGFCRCKSSQECLNAVIFVVIEECFSSCVAALSNLLLVGFLHLSTRWK